MRLSCFLNFLPDNALEDFYIHVISKFLNKIVFQAYLAPLYLLAEEQIFNYNKSYFDVNSNVFVVQLGMGYKRGWGAEMERGISQSFTVIHVLSACSADFIHCYIYFTEYIPEIDTNFQSNAQQ